MGMFDNIRCKYPLDTPGANDLQYQTKDTPCQMLDNYEIREDGSLWVEMYELEDHGDPTLTGVARWAGAMTKVNLRWEPTEYYSGIINFYTYTDTIKWIEFAATYEAGELLGIKLVRLEVDQGGVNVCAQLRQELTNRGLYGPGLPVTDVRYDATNKLIVLDMEKGHDEVTRLVMPYAIPISKLDQEGLTVQPEYEGYDVTFTCGDPSTDGLAVGVSDDKRVLTRQEAMKPVGMIEKKGKDDEV